MENFLRKTQQSYDLIAHQYADNRSKSGIGTELQPQLDTFISHLPKSKGKILDLGCGPGHHTTYFVKKGFQVIGVDLSQAMLNLAKRKVKVAKFIKQDMRQISFKPEAFIGVWAAASLFHIPKKDLPPLMSKLHLYLTTRGVLFAALKEGRGESFDERPKYGIPISRFFSYYTKAEFINLLNKHSFKTTTNFDWISKNGTHWFSFIASKT